MNRTYLLIIPVIAFNLLLIQSLHATFDTSSQREENPLTLIRIKPTGEDVPPARQIVFEFNQPVVPVGRMERNAEDIPITIEPIIACQWRWLNTTSLACQLDGKNALKPSTRYQITVNPGLKTEQGKIFNETVKHTFTTQRPAVETVSFKTWRAPGMPQLRITFNQPVTQKSIEKHLYFQLPSLQRVPLSAQRTGEEGKAWTILPEKLLPLDTAISLNIEAGIISTAGTEIGVEKRQVTAFHTFPKFEFLGIECVDLEDNSVIVNPNNVLGLRQRCNPMRQVALLFSSPVIKEVIEENLWLSPNLAGDRNDYNPWERSSSYSQLDGKHNKAEMYKVWLPELLKAYTSYQLRIVDTVLFKDEFGRSLPSPVEMKFLTDHRPPNYVFEHQVSVLERGVDSEVPIFVTNLQKIDVNFRRLTENGWSDLESKVLTVPKVLDVAFKIPFGVRELVSEQGGIVKGQFVSTPRLSDDEETEDWFFSQVTPFHLQVKIGHFNTLVWVTDFVTGQPVANATISIYPDSYALSAHLPADILAKTVTNTEGIALLPGTEALDPKLEHIDIYDRETPRLFIRCEKEGDVALLSLDYEFSVHMYDVVGGDYDLYPQMQPKYGHIRAWGTTAQGVYKVGDTLQYKFFVRNQDNKRFIAPPRESYQLKVSDPSGKVVHEIKSLSLNEFGSYADEFQIPKNAAVGWYSFELKADFTEEAWYPLRVLVSDFTPSPFRVRTLLKNKLFHVNEKVEIETFATLHAGGAYTDAKAKVNATLKQDTFETNHPQANGFQFDVYVEEASDDTVFQVEDTLDKHGELKTAFTLAKSSPVLYGQLVVESAVQDDRGKNVANVATASYVGRDRFVGLKETSWLLTAEQPAETKVIVVDEYGNPVSDTVTQVEIEYQQTKAARVKGAGNAYLTQYQHEWIPISACDIPAQLIAQTCVFTPPKAGIYRVTAKIADTQGRIHSTRLQQWAIGKGQVLWETSPGNALELVPEQSSYRVGEVARYLVKNPYPGSQGLITVERLGVLKSWVKTFNDSTEVIEIPVEADYVPGFFVSVVVMSPRVEKPIDANQVDLGKPAFRMGYARTLIEDPYKALHIEIKTDKPVYKPREQVTVDLQVQETDEPLELAVTVLDESVFDLLAKGRDYFDPYKGFYTLGDLDMGNFSLLMRLVGRQKFEKKGANAGGDGGMGLGMRSLFKFVSYWNPTIKTDDEGKARVQFTVPDNLTGWRIFALAVTPTDRMGLADKNFKVNQAIEIRPALPNQVLNGDSFQAGFTIMNRTEQLQNIEVTLSARGAAEIATCPTALAQCGTEQTVRAEPFKRYTLWLPLKTTKAGEVVLSISAKSEQEQDGLTHHLTVHKRRSLETAATYGTTTEDKIIEKIAVPEHIYTEVGGLQVIASPTVIGGLEGAFSYMRDYPYACWEQKLSKGTMAAQYQNLRDYLTVEWQGSETLAQETLALATEYQAPNGGMAFYVAQDQYVSPYLSAYTALTFNWLRESHYHVPATVENKLHEYLATLLRKEVMPDFYSAGMASSIRSVALAALAKHGKVTRDDLKRYEPHLAQMDLFGKVQFLMAALEVPKTLTIQNRVVDELLSHADETAGKISFTEMLDDGYQQMLTSPLRTQCAILQGLLAYSAVSQGERLSVTDLSFKLARQITQSRSRRGHWENTQENMFCMNALSTFARHYEAEKPNMTVLSRLADTLLPVLGRSETSATFEGVKSPAVTFEQAMNESLVGQSASVSVERSGTGRLYYTVRLSYAPTEEAATAVNAGIAVDREYHLERDGQWILLESPFSVQTGDLVRVDLYISLPAPRHFVVVDSAVPGGLEPVDRHLATASTVDANKAKGNYAGGSWWFKYDDWKEYGVSRWNFYHQELRHDAVRFYADYLPAGNYHLAYVAQAIAPGEFSVLPTQVEEMYNPEVYGKSLPAHLQVVKD